MSMMRAARGIRGTNDAAQDKAQHCQQVSPKRAGEDEVVHELDYISQERRYDPRPDGLLPAPPANEISTQEPPY